MSVQHPGKILFIDADGVQADNEVDAASVPESIRFAETKDGLVPVVKVVKTTAGDVRYIREYGVDGALLRSTTQVRDPEPPKRRGFTTD